MVLILLVIALAALPLLFLNSFSKLALVSTYAGLAHLLFLGGLLLLMWFGLHKSLSVDNSAPRRGRIIYG